MKKAISLGVAAAMAATLLAGCGTAASAGDCFSSQPDHAPEVGETVMLGYFSWKASRAFW